MNRPLMNKNHVSEIIKTFQASKATGKFTFRAGRYVVGVMLSMGMQEIDR